MGGGYAVRHTPTQSNIPGMSLPGIRTIPGRGNIVRKTSAPDYRKGPHLHVHLRTISGERKVDLTIPYKQIVIHHQNIGVSVILFPGVEQVDKPSNAQILELNMVFQNKAI
ncbi:hypothetical protein JTE90_025678 [Oedothorax gibbosus]|uniref:Uncharacterized protein n=1 Tax=Oedothorax gibbosus TaxID=931172 RepID=A0AAV6UCX0_9ARAC|nr:hypothetical protein JTE90_025678 [Oedothorax gibbosus]